MKKTFGISVLPTQRIQKTLFYRTTQIFPEKGQRTHNQDTTMKAAVHFFTTKNLLSLIACCGALNLIYLLLYAGLDSDEERYPSRLLGRQISSIDEDNKYPAMTNYGHLEMMNFDLKEILDRYSLAMNTLGKNFEQAHRARKRQKNADIGEHGGKIKKMPRCVNPLFLLIQVHSSPVNFLSREAIRLSWGRPENAINQGSWSKPERSWKTVFLVGKSNDSRMNDLLKQEAQLYGDIITGDFLDTFRHLSHKMLLSIEWPLKHDCRPKYILKTDEDCYINIISLLLWLNDYHNVNSSKELYRGKVQRNIEVERDEDSRYFVPDKDFKGMFFKPYISGGGYLFSGNLLARLHKAKRAVRLIPVEDAYFGMLMDHLGVRPEMDSRFLPFINCERSYETLFERPMCHFKDPFVIHGVNEVQQIHMHYNVLIMNFMPTICSYVESQSEQSYLKRIC